MTVVADGVDDDGVLDDGEYSAVGTDDGCGGDNYSAPARVLPGPDGLYVCCTAPHQSIRPPKYANALHRVRAKDRAGTPQAVPCGPCITRMHKAVFAKEPIHVPYPCLSDASRSSEYPLGVCYGCALANCFCRADLPMRYLR